MTVGGVAAAVGAAHAAVGGGSAEARTEGGKLVVARPYQLNANACTHAAARPAMPAVQAVLGIQRHRTVALLMSCSPHVTVTNSTPVNTLHCQLSLCTAQHQAQHARYTSSPQRLVAPQMPSSQ